MFGGDVDVDMIGPVGEGGPHDRFDDVGCLVIGDGTHGAERSDLEIDPEGANCRDRFGDVRTRVALHERFDRELNTLH